MGIRRAVACGVLVVVVSGTGVAAATPATKITTCAQLNRIYPHGVGRPGAVDKRARKTAYQVTNFTRNAKVYNQYKSLDHDHDGIACEKK